MITPFSPTDGQGNPGASFDGVTFTPEQVAQGDIERQAAIAAQAPPPPAAPLSGRMVDMVGPDGAAYSVPEENIAKARAKGYRPETDEDRSVREFDAAHPWASPLAAWYKSVVGGPTLGVVDDKEIGWAVEKLAPLMGSKVTREQVQAYVKKAADDHQFISTAGDVAGFLLSLPAAAGAAAVGVGAAAKAGAVGAKVAGNWAGRAAIEGLAITLPKAFREVVEGDPAKAGESLAWGIGGNVVMSGALHGVSSLLKGGPSLEARAQEWAGKSLGGAEARTKIINEWGGEDPKKAIQQVGKYIMEDTPFSEDLIFGRLRTKDALLKEHQEWVKVISEEKPSNPAEWQVFRDKAAARGWDVEKAVSIRNRTGMSTIRSYDIADEAGSFVGRSNVNGVTGKEVVRNGKVVGFKRDPSAHGGFSFSSFERQIKPWLDEITRNPALRNERASLLTFMKDAKYQNEKFVEDSGRLPFRKVLAWSRALADKTDQNAQDTFGVLRKEFYRKLDLDLERQAKLTVEKANKIDPGKFNDKLIDELNAYQDHYRKAMVVQDALIAEVKHIETSAAMPIGAQSWGVAGAIGSLMLMGTPGAIAYGLVGAAAHKFLRTKGNLMLSKVASGMPNIEAGMRGFGREFLGIPAAINGALPGAVPAHALSPSVVFTSWLAGRSDEASSVSPTASETAKLASRPTDPAVASYVQLSNDLTTLASDPMKLHTRLREVTDEVAKESPAVAASIAQHYASMVSHLNQVAPKSSGVGTPFAPTKPSFSKSELQTFAERMLVADDPHWVQHFLSTRTLKKEHMDTLKAVWPASYRSMVERIQDHAMSGSAKPIDYKGQLQLSLLTGVAMTPHASPQSIRGYQKLYVQENLGGAPGVQGVMKAANMSRLDGPGKGKKTSSQHIEER